jgi:crotonobetainyl-CoA:carnitine CoA-transferase CaiB-like acyl-CoA transferase
MARPSQRVPRGPLSGLRVIDASRVLAGPYLAMLLGDLGADVIKIEKPDGGDQTRGWGPPFVGPSDSRESRVSAYFVSANRNKRSIVLDLKSPAGRLAFRKLLATADVLVENFLPAEWRKLGFRGTNFRNPRLVHASITGYGAGPDADRPAYDVVLQAESGLMSLTGFGEGEPVRVGVAVIDFLSALYGLSGVLAALVERGVTGKARKVEVSMIDAGTAFLSYAAQSWLADGRQPPALGSRHPNLAPYQALPVQDGWFLVGVGSQDQWSRFCQALQHPGLEADPRFATNADRVRNRAELDDLLAGIFRRKPAAEWDRLMREHRIPAAAPASVGESVERARERGQLLQLPAGIYGDLSTLAAPFLFDGRRCASSLPPPGLGEHTEEVLREMGLNVYQGQPSKEAR